MVSGGAWVAQSVKRLPSAQVVISGSWDRAAHGTSCSLGVCFSLSLCPFPTCALSPSLSQINKDNPEKKKVILQIYSGLVNSCFFCF